MVCLRPLGGLVTSYIAFDWQIAVPPFGAASGNSHRRTSCQLVPPFFPRQFRSEVKTKGAGQAGSLPYGNASTVDSQDCGQPIVMRIRVAGVLAEGFAVFHADFFAAGGGPAFAVLHVFVDPVLLAEP